MRGATTGFAIALLNQVAHAKRDQENTEGKDQNEDPVKNEGPKEPIVLINQSTKTKGIIKYFINDSSAVVYVKSEGDVIVNGIAYEDNSAIPIQPGESINEPIDGAKVIINGEITVLKVLGKYSFFYSNLRVTDKGFDISFYGFGNSFMQEAIQTVLPAVIWNKLWDSTPYIP